MPTETEDKPEASAPVKTLSATERRSLEKIVKNDYDTLYNDLHAMYQQAHKDADREYREATGKAQADAAGIRETLAEKIEAASTRIRKDLDAVFAAAAKAGYDLEVVSAPGRYQDPFTASDVHRVAYRINGLNIAGIKERYAETINTLDQQYHMANRILDKKRLETQRTLLLSAITSDVALDFLNAIPSAKELFTAAITEQQAALEA